MSEKLLHRVSISIDEEKIFLSVEYDGIFYIDKMFRNNAIGLMNMQKVRESLSSDDKVLDYLGIGGTK